MGSRSEALAGLRVLDLGSGPASGLATMILADFGAEVLAVTRPDGDALQTLAARSLWMRGKRTLVLDAALDRDRLDALIGAADVLISNWRPAALARHGLTPEALRARWPSLIVAHVSGFGDRGPLAQLPGYEHLVAAKAGRMRLFSGIVERDGPVFSALQVGVHACAQSTVSGILAALHARQQDGVGTVVRTSILQGLLAYDQWPLILEQFRPRFPDAFPPAPPPSPEPPLPTLFYHPAQAGDGRWLQFGNLLPHLFDNFLRVADLLDILIEPEFDPAQMLVRDPERHEAVRLRMLEQIQTRSASDWMADFVADGGVVAGRYQTTQEALDDPDVIANGHVIARADGGVELGPVARLQLTPAVPGGAAVADDGLLEAAWAAAPARAFRPESGFGPASVPASGPASGPAIGVRTALPLAGLKVVEIATIIAAPMGAGCLADMGANVIKVEQIGGDPYRGLQSGLGAARVNAGKRSISLDLKAEAGRAIVLDLLRDADVLIHNYRPGVPERLGIGYEQVAAINPRIVYVQANGYGPDGPGALRPSTHPIPGAAMGGVLFQFGGHVPTAVLPVEQVRTWTRRLMCANEVNPDPNTAVVIATSALLGVAARDHTGRAQRVLVDMFGANAWANHDDFLRYPGKPDRLQADPGLHGLGPTYRLYRAGEGQWLFLALTTRREALAFDAVLADLSVSSAAAEAPCVADRFDGSSAERAALAEALAKLFVTRTADDWEALFVAAGVGCVRADGALPSTFWRLDPQPQALGLTAPAVHPLWGEYQRHGRLVLFDAGDQPLGQPPMAGQHNVELLQGIGRDAGTAADLAAAGVIWADPRLQTGPLPGGAP